MPDDQPGERGRELGRWERWSTDPWGNPIVEFDSEAHAEWADKWIVECPDGYPQRLTHALGFRERNVGELELRVAIANDDNGACQVIVDEQAAEIHVRVSICYDEEAYVPPDKREYIDCPVRVWLDAPVGDRAVIDVDTDEELDLYTPKYRNSVVQPDWGYRPARRRRRGG